MKNHILCHTGEKPPQLSNLQTLSLADYTIQNPNEPDASSQWRKVIFRTKICESCDKKFMSSGILKKHIVFHTGEKPFFQDPDLWIMWQQVHVKCNLKEAHSFPYWREANFRTRICESCDKKFMSSAILKNHIVFHTGEKPFSGPGFVNPVIKSSCREES